MNKKSAFTLAEALLALTMIGVIAAMTIPGLREYSQELEYVASAKKSYSVAQAATTTLEATYGDSKWWNWSSTKQVNDRYKTVMNQADFDYSYDITYLDGQAFETVSNTNWFQTTDGMIWRTKTYTNTKGAYGAIYVDTNGENLPNVVGVDVMGFVVTNDGVYPFDDGLHDDNSEWGCTYYAIQKGKMPWINNPAYTSCANASNELKASAGSKP